MQTKEEVESQIEVIAKKNGKYKPDAYRYALQVIADVFALKKASIITDEQISLPAREVLRGLKVYGWMYYGPLAEHVFEKWGLRHGKDFGEVIFDLVDAGFIGKSPNESVTDYAEGFDFEWEEDTYWDLSTNADVLNYITSCSY